MLGRSRAIVARRRRERRGSRALIAFLPIPRSLPSASTTEVYGDGATPPPDAIVYFQGTDARAGPLLKFTSIEPHVHT